MKSNTIYLPITRPPKPARENTVVRLAPEIFDQLTDLAYKTAMSKMELASILLKDAISRVELVERKIYELHMQSEEEEASPDD